MSVGRSKLQIRLPSVCRRIFHVLLDDIELFSLLAHNVRNVPEEFIQFSDALLDVPDLGLSFDDQGFLKINLIL